jgi:hypothetical protein
VTCVTADSRTDTGVDILNDLDFEPVLACEHSLHREYHIEDDPAVWVVTSRCPICTQGKRFLLCESGRVDMLDADVVCRYCGWETSDVHDLWVSIVPLDIR